MKHALNQWPWQHVKEKINSLKFKIRKKISVQATDSKQSGFLFYFHVNKRIKWGNCGCT